jgi:hypothetical protein
MDEKKRFQLYLKRKISDSSWFRVKRLMVKYDLEVTKTNLEIVAKLKLESMLHKIPLETSLIYYLESANIQVSITGKDLYQHLQELTNYTPHRTTIIRWFDGSYNPEKTYQSSELSKILLSAFLYNLRNKNHDISKSVLC